MDPLEKCAELLEFMAREQTERSLNADGDEAAFEHAAKMLNEAAAEIRSWQHKP